MTKEQASETPNKKFPTKTREYWVCWGQRKVVSTCVKNWSTAKPTAAGVTKNKRWLGSDFRPVATLGCAIASRNEWQQYATCFESERLLFVSWYFTSGPTVVMFLSRTWIPWQSTVWPESEGPTHNGTPRARTGFNYSECCCFLRLQVFWQTCAVTRLICNSADQNPGPHPLPPPV